MVCFAFSEWGKCSNFFPVRDRDVDEQVENEEQPQLEKHGEVVSSLWAALLLLPAVPPVRFLAVDNFGSLALLDVDIQVDLDPAILFLATFLHVVCI